MKNKLQFIGLIMLIAIPFYSVAQSDEMKAIDLGLSVKWASHNIGANNKMEYGSYVGWADPTGERTTIKGVMDGRFNWISRYYGGVNPVECISGTRADIAKIKLGDWRLPTKEEFKELCENCKWVWGKFGDLRGYKVIGPNGKSIFFPAGGCRVGDDKEDEGDVGYYWSGTLNNESKNSAWILGIKEGEYSSEWKAYRCYGLLVRPVQE